MATLREIRGRINSIKSTEKITRAMKMVAAVKFRKAQESILAARPYARKINEILTTLIPTLPELGNELLREREVKKLCIVVVTSDRGLCGSFNTNLIKAAEQIIKIKYADFYNTNNLTLITIGRKAYIHFSKRNYDIYARYLGVFDRLEFTKAREIVNDIIEGYTKDKFDKILFVYNEFKSAVQCRIVEEQFMPVGNIEKDPEIKHTKVFSEFIFEPDAKAIVDYLLPKHLNTQMWRILLESNASEQSQRMIAMESATKNANDLMKELQLHYNKARQAAITKEILEVSGGAEALREKG